MSYSLLGLDEPTNPKKPSTGSKAPSKYSSLGLDDASATPQNVPTPAPKAAPAPAKTAEVSLPKYDEAAKANGKESTGFWSKVGSVIKDTAKGAGDELAYLGAGVLDWWGNQRKKSEEADFKMRQIMYPKKNDPTRIIVDKETGQKRMVNNALEQYNNAKSPEEKAKIIAEDTKQIPIIKFLNSPTGEKLKRTVAEETSNIPLKAWARFQTVGDEIYEAFEDPSFSNIKDIATASGAGKVIPFVKPSKSNREKTDKNYKALKTEAEDETNPRWQKILYGVQNSAVQSAIGTLLSVGTSYLTRNPKAGTAVGTAYFGLISADEEANKYPNRQIDSTSAIGNIAIDTIGDQMISGLAESTLKNFAKESSKVTLKTVLGTGAKGFLVEGGTEPTQSLIKYANDYTAARTEEKKQAIVASFSDYIKSGAMVDEFLIGGISGAGINVAANGAGTLIKPVVNVSGNTLTETEVTKLIDDITPEVKKAMEDGSVDVLVNIVEDRYDLPEEAATRVIQEAAQDIIADNANREAPQGSAERDALEEDVTTLLEQGYGISEVSTKVQDLLNVSSSYAESVVASALAKINNSVENTNAELGSKIDALAKPVGKEFSYEEIVTKLREANLKEDTVSKVGKALVTALSRQGTTEEKAAAIKILSNPKNEASRAIYQQESGTTLPDTQAGSQAMLERAMNKPLTREYAEQVISSDLNLSKGYRSYSPTGSVSQETSPVGAASETSPVGEGKGFPDWLPQEMQSQELLDEVKPYLEQGIRPNEKENPALAKAYDVIDAAVTDKEAQLEKDAIDLNEPNAKASNSDIAYQVAHAQITDEATITMGEAEAIIRKYFTEKEVSLTFVKNMRTPRGIEAWGKYAQQVITLVENPKSDTPHHEAVHAFLDLFVPSNERADFLDTAYADAVERHGQEKIDEQVKNIKDRYDNKITAEKAKSIYSEEALAEGFYEYVQGRNQKSTLAKFYEQVIAFLKSIVGKADAQRLYEEIIAQKRYGKIRNEQALALSNKIDTGAQDPTLFSIKNRIHAEDRALVEKFIDSVRVKGNEISDTEFKGIERLAEKWGVNMDKGLSRVANEFEKILSNQKKVTGTILYSEKDDYQMSHRPTEGLAINNIERTGGDIEMPKGFVSDLESYFSTDGNEYGAATRESIAAVRKFDGKPDDAVVTIYRAAPSAKLNSGDWVTLSKKYATLHAKSSGDAAVKVQSFKVPASSVHFAGDDINEFGYYPDSKPKADTAMFSEKDIPLEDQLKAIIAYKKNAYGKRYTEADQKGDGMQYSAITRGLTGNLTATEKSNVRKYLESAHVGKKVMYDGKSATIVSTPSFGNTKIEIDGVEKSVPIQKLVQAKVTDEMVLAQAKKEATAKAQGQIALYGNRVSQAQAEKTTSITRSSTFAVKPFENLAKKNEEFKAANEGNTETHAINLGKEKVEVEDAKVQKTSGNTDGLYTEAYTVVIKRGEKERVIFTSEDPKAATKWLKENAGKKVSIDKNETASVLVDGDKASVIVTSPDVISMEASLLGGTTNAKEVTFYDTTGDKIETRQLSENTSFKQVAEVTEEKKAAKLTPFKVAIKDNSLKGTFPNYFAVISGNPVLVKTDSTPVSRETYVKPETTTESDKVQTSQQPLEANKNYAEKIKKSGAYQKAKARLTEFQLAMQEDPTYTAMKVDDQMAKAFQLLDENPEYARAVALGLEQPPLDIADTAISLAVAERAKETGDFRLQAEAEKARSLRQTRRGQELNLERGRVNEDSPEFFIKQLIDRRKKLAEAKYKPVLGKVVPFTEMVDERVKEAKKKAGKKLKTDLEIKGEELDSFLAEMAC